MSSAEKQLAATAEKWCRQLFPSSAEAAAELLPALRSLRTTWESVATATLDKQVAGQVNWHESAKQRSVSYASAIAQAESALVSKGQSARLTAQVPWNQVVCQDLHHLQTYLDSGLPVSGVMTANIVALGAVFETLRKQRGIQDQPAAPAPTPPKSSNKKAWIILAVVVAALAGGAVLYARQQRG